MPERVAAQGWPGTRRGDLGGAGPHAAAGGGFTLLNLIESWSALGRFDSGPGP